MMITLTSLCQYSSQRFAQFNIRKATLGIKKKQEHKQQTDNELSIIVQTERSPISGMVSLFKMFLQISAGAGFFAI